MSIFKHVHRLKLVLNELIVLEMSYNSESKRNFTNSLLSLDPSTFDRMNNHIRTPATSGISTPAIGEVCILESWIFPHAPISLSNAVILGFSGPLF